MELKILKKVEQFNTKMIKEGYPLEDRRKKSLNLMIYLVRESIKEEKKKDENGK